MDNFHLSVIAVALSFHLPGSVGTTSQQSLLDTHHPSGCRWDGDFSVNCSFTGTSAIPEDLSQPAITADFSYNNIKTFTCAEGRSEEWKKLKHLNLSNNLISELSLTTCRNLPLLETLNLNGNAIHAFTLGLPTPQKDSDVDHLLPALTVLSVERNNLNSVPRGLGLLQSLQTLRLSSNGIRQLGPRDFGNCSQLKDIHLQNNQISEIHPDAFRDLNKLQVVDLRENALATPLPQILMSLNFFRLEVGSSNNAWIFNCRPNAFKHLFHFRFDSTRKKWSVSYNVSATNSQKPLLYLSSIHLNCSHGVLLKRAVIPAGRTSVLNCDLDNTRGHGVSWWTPKGRISKDDSVPHMTLDQMNNLVIHDAERTAGGLYLCTSGTTKKKYLLYSIELKERVSTVREARDATAGFRQGGQEQELALAVSLSVLITFLCAFCLGALARPYLGSLWRLMCRNKNSGSGHAYSNPGFSDETSGRERSASKPTNTQHDLFASDENSPRKTCFSPTEASTLQENVVGINIQAPNTEEEHQNQSNNENNVISGIKPSISNHENTTAGDNGLSSGRSQDHKNSNEVAQFEITKPTPDSPERKGIFPLNEPTSATKFMPGRQSHDEQLGLNSNTNTTSDVGDSVLPRTCKRDSNLENLHLHQTTESSPLEEYDCKTERTSEKYAPADIFGDSSSDEGTPFTLSDCSSLADLELEQPESVSDNLPVWRSSLEEATMKSGAEKFSALPESPTVAEELQCTGGNEDESNAYCETTAHDGSGTTLPKTASPCTDKCSHHLSISDSDTTSSSSRELPATFDCFTDAEPTGQTPDSLHNQSTDFGSTFLLLQHSPTCDTEKVPEEAEVQLYQFPVEPERSLSSTPPAQKAAGPEGSREEDTEWNPSEKNHGEGDVTFRRTTSISEDGDFIFAPLDTGLNEIVKNTSPLHSSDQPSLQSLPERRAGKHLRGVPEEDDLLPRGKEVDTTEACTEEMQTGFGEENCDGFTESEDTSNCSLPQETPPGNLRADLLHLHSSGDNTEDSFQLDQREEDTYSLSVPQGSFHESTRCSSWSFPQQPPGNTISRSSDSSRREEDAARAGLESSSTAATNPQHSREKLSQKSQTNLGQGQVFVKKKRAFDGFANILQSRGTNFNS